VSRVHKQRRSPVKRWRNCQSWRKKTEGRGERQRNKEREDRTQGLVVKEAEPTDKMEDPRWKHLHQFFDFNKESLKANTMGWPRIKSHDPRNCLKHQCVGSCSSKCGMTHVIPEKLD
jgi:hypothetical protein